ncbi:hypothetical protein STRCI_000077 [Streptomyces cinnabarinus]|uniref:DUF732 domain-containing protein n=1 Tax=Streptomyces cinnabarinus TaxID=67287 RepID=A0ABY7K7C4_9ACTN|nr:hypothetical protein [Streptomyces cinnabarinus]WAZ19057.1 hypothetical protein STRCI_000077 [Streptomyces cinnabarinus]
MRSIKAFIIAVSVGALSLGATTASQAFDLTHPGAKQTRPQVPAGGGDHEGGKHGKGGKGGHIKGYDLDHSCVGKSFGFCTQKLVYAPKLLGDITLTNGLIGLIGTTTTPPTTNGTTTPPTTNGTTTPPTTNGTTTPPTTNGTTTPPTTNGTTTPPANQWCSPGFWAQNPGAWMDPNRGDTPYNPALTVPPGSAYLDSFPNEAPLELSPAGENAGNVPLNPSLRYMLLNAQYYDGPPSPGERREQIADLLSDAAGLQWTDPENHAGATCPFSADEANGN